MDPIQLRFPRLIAAILEEMESLNIGRWTSPRWTVGDARLPIQRLRTAGSLADSKDRFCSHLGISQLGIGKILCEWLIDQCSSPETTFLEEGSKIELQNHQNIKSCIAAVLSAANRVDRVQDFIKWRNKCMVTLNRPLGNPGVATVFPGGFDRKLGLPALSQMNVRMVDWLGNLLLYTLPKERLLQSRTLTPIDCITSLACLIVYCPE